MLGSSHDGLYLERTFPLIDDGCQINETDVDVVFEFTGVTVTENRETGGQHGTIFLLENTFPGYVKMRVVTEHPKEQDESEEYLLPMVLRGKLDTAIKSSKFAMYLTNKTDGPALHGAIEDELGVHSLDYVIGMSMRSWPSVASEILTRPRASGWPSAVLIQKATKQGCGFVPVGHPLSSEAHLEWRISFAISERILLLSLTITQIKAYVFFKALCKLNLCNDDDSFLTSYMLKNVLFWTLEKIPLEIWTSENLFQCIKELVTRLEAFLDDRCIPNYFVPSRNMIQHIEQSRILDLRNKLGIMKVDIIGELLRHTDGQRIPSVLDLSYSVLFAKLAAPVDPKDRSLLLSDVYFIAYLTLRLQAVRYLSNLSISTLMYIRQRGNCSILRTVPACAARFLIKAIIHCDTDVALTTYPEMKSFNLDILTLRKRAVAFIATEIYKGKLKNVIADQEFATNETVSVIPEFSVFVEWVDLTCRWCGSSPLIDGQSRWTVYDID
ncbi:uncharacterized protein LOC134229915 [Saccostrea cucullata]|uniref:uncharacterized protein LOC134229915 n=1 Tax=Saccostrea cuccullata TaxID=36930 RepID=UPI002ED131B0